MKKKKGKAIVVEQNKNHTRFGGRHYFFNSRGCFKYIDSNNCGDVFFTFEDRKNLLQKWELILEDSPNFLIRNYTTGFYLGTDELGGVYCGLLTSSPYQRWKFFATSEPELYVVMNAGSHDVLDVIDKSETLYVWPLENPDDAKESQLFKVYPLNIQKR